MRQCVLCVHWALMDALLQPIMQGDFVDGLKRIHSLVYLSQATSLFTITLLTYFP